MASWGKTDALASAPKWITTPREFDGTSTDVVSVDDDTITIPSHGRVTGDPLVYTSTGAITGLVTDTTYYTIRVDSDTIALAETLVDAEAGTKIELTAVGTDDADVLMHAPSDLYFIDITEAKVASNRAKGLKSPGWWKYSTYTDVEGDTRHRAELLVAIAETAANAGDADDDSVVADT